MHSMGAKLMDKGKHEKNDVYVVTEDYIPKTESVEHKTILRTRVVTMNCYFLHTGSSVSIDCRRRNGCGRKNLSLRRQFFTVSCHGQNSKF